MRNEIQIREEMCRIGHQMYQRCYIVGTDGNMSVRLPGNIMLFTASGVCKGQLVPEQILKTDFNGTKISGPGKPSSEIQMHLLVYRQRPDVRAIVHAHPPLAVALTVAGKSLEKILLPEVVVHLGKIATAPYATPGTVDLAHSIRPFLEETNAIVLERHGVITVGQNLTQAYYRMEYVEYAAQIAWLAQQVGPMPSLPPEEIEKLRQASKE